MSEHIIKITGTANIPEPLKNGHDYTVGLAVNVDGKNEKPNNEGGYDYTYNLKMLGDFVLQDEHGKNIYATSRASASKKFRNRLNMIHNGEDFDLVYERIMGWIISEKLEGLYEEFFKNN